MAIESVTDNAGSVWVEQVIDVIVTVAKALPELTIDDVVRAGVPSTYDARALGGAMRKAASRGFIVSTKSYRPSERIERHYSPVLKWRSLIVEGDL